MQLARAVEPAGTGYLPTSRFQVVHAIAREFACDIAIPNATGIGDVLMYTRVVVEMGMRKGRALKLLTGRMQPVAVGTVEREEPYPIWKANPYVGQIVDPIEVAPEALQRINEVHEIHCQFGHMIKNICAEYGFRPRQLKPCLYLTEDEQARALATLAHIPRPILCIHPYGTSSPLPEHPWHRREWELLLAQLPPRISVVELGMAGRDHKGLEVHRFDTTLREMMAILWACDMFIGFDSSPAHMATAFDKPATVLWDPLRKNELDERFRPGYGPAAMHRWGYPDNNNLVLLGETNGEIRAEILHWVVDTCRSIGADV